MGKKRNVRDLPWFRHYPKDYLGDLAILQLNHLERGVLHSVNSILWAHTDEAGFYSINGVAGTEEELLEATRSYSGSARLERRKSTSNAIKKLIRAGHLIWGVDGILYSKYLVSLIEKCELQSKRGAEGGVHKHKKKDKEVVPEVNHTPSLELESEREARYKDTLYPLPPENHSAGKQKKPLSMPPAEAHKVQEYQIEVLNKCFGRDPKAEHPEHGFLLSIGYQIPRKFVWNALASMQDKRNNNQNPDAETVYNLEAYYFATLKGMCKDQGIVTSFWKD